MLARGAQPGRPGIAGSAIAAVDIALWDLRPRSSDLGSPTRSGAPRRACRCTAAVASPASPTRSWPVSSPVGSTRDPCRQDEGRREPARDGTGSQSRARRSATASASSSTPTGLHAQAGPRHGRDVRGVRRDVVRGAGELGRPRRASPRAGSRRRPAWTSPRANTATTCPTSGECSAAGAVDCLQADVTRCGGITGVPPCRRPADAHCLELSSHTAPAGERPRRCACVWHCAISSSSRTTSASGSDAVRRRARRPSPGRCIRIPTRPGSASSSSAPTPSGSGDEGAPVSRPQHFEGMDTVTPVTISRRAGDDAHALADRTRRRHRGRGPLRRRQPRGLLDRRVELPAGADRRRGPATVDDVIATVAPAAARRARSPAAAAAPASPASARNVAVVIDFSKYMNRVCSIDPEQRAARVVEPGCNLDELRGTRRRARPHLRARSRDPQPQHARRDDRQQLLRRALGDGGVLRSRPAHRHQVDRARRPHLRRPALHRRRDLRRRARAHRRAATTPGAEIYRGAARAPRSLRARDPRPLPDIPRRVSGYNLDALLPENGFHVAQALVGTEGTCVVVLEATVRLIDAKPARSLVVLGYPDVYAAGGPRAADPGAPAGRPRGDRRRAHRLHEEEGAAPRRRRPAARRRRVAAGRVRRRHQGRHRRAGAR